jgi:predicted transcriptional regulator YdeE
LRRFEDSHNPETVYKDLPKVYKRYMALKESGQVKYIKEPWEYVSLSMNFDSSQAWDYYTGYVVGKFDPEANHLVNFKVPKGDYAVFEIRCKSKFFFGWKIGKLKRYIYTKWLPASEYEFTGFEYEYNNEEMARKSAYDIDLYVGIRKK